MVEDLTGQPKLGAEHRKVEAGISRASIRRKGKTHGVVPAQASQRNHRTTTCSRGSVDHTNTFGLRGKVEVFEPRCGRHWKINIICSRYTWKT
jgi:hypothetical protein